MLVNSGFKSDEVSGQLHHWKARALVRKQEVKQALSEFEIAATYLSGLDEIECLTELAEKQMGANMYEDCSRTLAELVPKIKDFDYLPATSFMRSLRNQYYSCKTELSKRSSALK